ncbi:hypothetical protein A6R68_23671 [Neotoma lepida]|uniref:Uncharacterized protein n=1 Tax=Neotoma lepida TaxID=56216 RepID=A0A1A6HVT3_NEOLE|nr:hypothetical protein A6R68_23671 [Neotoma lepida]
MADKPEPTSTRKCSALLRLNKGKECQVIHMTEPVIFPHPPQSELRTGGLAPCQELHISAVTTTILNIIFITIITTTVTIQRSLPAEHKASSDDVVVTPAASPSPSEAAESSRLAPPVKGARANPRIPEEMDTTLEMLVRGPGWKEEKDNSCKINGDSCRDISWEGTETQLGSGQASWAAELCMGALYTPSVQSSSHVTFETLFCSTRLLQTIERKTICHKEEGAALGDVLKEHTAHMAVGDNDSLQNELQDRKRVHKGSAISKVVDDPTSTISGVLDILGLQLGWVWKQQLLQLCCPCDCGETSRWSIGVEARSLVGVSMDVMNESPGTLDLTLNVLKATKTILTNLKALGQHTMHSDGQRQPSHGSRWQDLHNHWEMPFPSSHSGYELCGCDHDGPVPWLLTPETPLDGAACCRSFAADSAFAPSCKCFESSTSLIMSIRMERPAVAAPVIRASLVIARALPCAKYQVFFLDREHCQIPQHFVQCDCLSPVTAEVRQGTISLFSIPYRVDRGRGSGEPLKTRGAYVTASSPLLVLLLDRLDRSRFQKLDWMHFHHGDIAVKGTQTGVIMCLWHPSSPVL